MYNVAIIGAGPAGIFAALEIMKLKPEWKVVLIEKGQRLPSLNYIYKFSRMFEITVDEVIDYYRFLERNENID